MINIQEQCPALLWVWLQYELVCDDPRNTILITVLEGEGAEKEAV